MIMMLQLMVFSGKILLLIPHQKEFGQEQVLESEVFAHQQMNDQMQMERGKRIYSSSLFVVDGATDKPRIFSVGDHCRFHLRLENGAVAVDMK